MSGSPPSAPSGVPSPRPEEPASAATADKRTLLIAMLVMFALVVVGVGSAAVFTRSACASLDPDPVAPGAAGTAVDAVVDATFNDLDAEVRASMIDELRALQGELGPLSGIAEVTGAQRLAPTATGVAATGSVTTLLSPDGAEILSRAEIAEGTISGSGDTLYALAVGNDLTGQIDATTPLDGDLQALTCVDTALINTPLAFHLDADAGELLLLRVDEDGSVPELELRDAVEGRVWGPVIDVGLAQPGVTGQRLTARLGPDLAVLGRRTAPGDEPPVLAAFDRATGEPRWSVERGDLGTSLSSDLPARVEVLEVARDLMLVALTPDEQDAATDADADVDGDADVGDDVEGSGEPGSRLVAVATSGGEMIWDRELDPGEIVQDAAVEEGRVWVTMATADGSIRVAGYGPDGEFGGSAVFDGERGRVAAIGDDRAVAVLDAGVVVVDQGSAALTAALVGRDAAVHDGGVTLLIDGPDGGSLAVTFAP